MRTRALGVSLIALAMAAGAAMASGPEALNPDKGTDWRDLWRSNRNALVEAKQDLKFDPTSVLVRFVPGTPESDREMVRAIIGGRLIESFDIVEGLEHLAIDMDVEQAVEVASKFGEALGVVDFAEPDYLYQIGATPNDTSYGLLWGMNNTGQTVNNDPGVANFDINAPEAWDITTGSAAVVVGMADSGFRATHEDLAANRWTNPGEIAGNNVDDDGNGRIDDVWGWDFWNNDKDPTDDNGHGTHTAGTVGAAGNNGRGVTGVCWTVKLVGLKIGSRTGSVSSTAGISAVQYCVQKGIKVSNHSWGGTGFSSSFDAAVTSARTAGHMLICAAGNSAINNDSTPFYPASYTQDNIISVASIDNNGAVSSFSNYGRTRVDLGAPGSTIASTYINRQKDNAYVYLSGTSMAAPHVTGVAALVWSRDPNLSYLDVRTRILSTVTATPSLVGKCVTEGRLNAAGAVQ